MFIVQWSRRGTHLLSKSQHTPIFFWIGCSRRAHTIQKAWVCQNIDGSESPFQSTSLAESQKALEAPGCKPWVTNLSIVPHTEGILTANTTCITYCIILIEYVNEAQEVVYYGYDPTTNEGGGGGGLILSDSERSNLTHTQTHTHRTQTYAHTHRQTDTHTDIHAACAHT